MSEEKIDGGVLYKIYKKEIEDLEIKVEKLTDKLTEVKSTTVSRTIFVSIIIGFSTVVFGLMGILISDINTHKRDTAKMTQKVFIQLAAISTKLEIDTDKLGED